MIHPQEKQASPLALLAGPIGHVATNVLGRAAHRKSNLSSVLAHKGLQHALTDSVVSPGAMRTTKSLLGPESVVPYDVAHKLGKRLREMDPVARQAFIENLYARTKDTKAPILSALRDAVGHELEGTVPSLQAKGLGASVYSRAVDAMTGIVDKPFDTGLQKAVKNTVGIAPLAAVSAADPVATAAHVGINATREFIGNSPVGKRVTENLFQRGLGGKQIPKYQEVASDLLLSPAVLDPYRAGSAIRAEVPSHIREQLTPATISSSIPQLKAFKSALTPPVSTPLASTPLASTPLASTSKLGFSKTALIPRLDARDLLTSALPGALGFYLGDTPAMSESQARDYARRDFTGPEMALMQGLLAYKQGRSSAARRILRDARYPQIPNPINSRVRG